MSTPEEKENSEIVTGVVEDALNAVRRRQMTQSTTKGWIFAIIAVILSTVAIAVLYWKLRARGRELARLKHERDLEKEYEIQARVDAEVAESIAQAEDALERAEESAHRVEDLEDQITEVHEQRVRTLSVINALDTWEDVERYLSGTSNEQTTTDPS